MRPGNEDADTGDDLSQVDRVTNPTIRTAQHQPTHFGEQSKTTAEAGQTPGRERRSGDDDATGQQKAGCRSAWLDREKGSNIENECSRKRDQALRPRGVRPANRRTNGKQNYEKSQEDDNRDLLEQRGEIVQRKRRQSELIADHVGYEEAKR